MADTVTKIDDNSIQILKAPQIVTIDSLVAQQSNIQKQIDELTVILNKADTTQPMWQQQFDRLTALQRVSDSITARIQQASDLGVASATTAINNLKGKVG